MFVDTLRRRRRLKIKEAAEILTQENFQKRENQLKRGTFTSLSMAYNTNLNIP